MAQLTKIVVRRDSAADWTSANPTLASGEIGYEEDTGKFKIGDGATAWASMDYVNYLSKQKDVTITDLAENQYLKWNGTAWVNATMGGGHTQNTDTGTTGSTFQIDSDASGPKLKNNSGLLEIRNSADDAYADLKCKDLTVAGSAFVVNAETMTIDDNIIVLNNNVTGSPGENAGIEVERGTETNASLIWDESSDSWKAGILGSETAIALVGAAPTAHAINGAQHTLAGATAGYFLKALSETTFGFAAHGLSYTDVGAAASGHNHSGTYIEVGSPEQGDVLYYSGSAWVSLSHGTAGQMLKTGGHGANPSWADVDGGTA